MNEIPGFTAEAALEPAIGRYRSATSATHLRSGRLNSRRAQNASYVQLSGYIPCSWCDSLYREDLQICEEVYGGDEIRLNRCRQQAKWDRDTCCRTGTYPK